MTRKLWIPVGLLITSMACSIARSIPDGRVIQGQVVNPKGKVLIMSVPDGQEPGQPVATGSGNAMVSAIVTVLVHHGVSATTSSARDLVPAYEEAEKLGIDYALLCRITQWEDNATAWSGNGDKLKISLDLYSAKERLLVASASHYRVGTGFTFTSGTPERFMEESAEGALNRIYGWTTSK